jgi:polyvinyl alcohol dehydrogenase (cytochrome)
MACTRAITGRVASALRWTLTAVLAMAVLSQPARADWPIYGHDLSNSRNAGGSGPSPDKVASMKQAWAFHSSTGDFTGTPVISGGVLVAGNNTGWVYALNAITGKLRWSRKVGQQVNGSAAIDLSAPGGATAFIPVANLGAPRLIALSLARGAMRWNVQLTKQPGADVFGSPTFWHHRVYIGTSGPNDDNSTARGSVVALDEATGRVVWKTYTVPRGHDGGAVWSTPAIDTVTGRIYVGTGNAYHAPAAKTTDSVMALAAKTGQVLKHYQATRKDVFTLPGDPNGADADFGASPNLMKASGGKRLVGDGAKNGTYYALDRASLRPVWHTNIGPGSASGGIIGSTAYDGTRIYGADTLNGSVFALRKNGSQAWSATDPSTLHYSPVAVGHGVLYSINPLGFLVARNARTGKGLNTLSLGGLSFGGVSVVGNAVYAAVGTGPAPGPAPVDGPGSIVAFGDTSRSGRHE